MDKKKINIKPCDTVTINFQKQYFEVLPYITNTTKFVMVKNYVSDLLSDDDIVTNYLVAEHKLVFSIINECTDIEFEGDAEELTNSIYSSGLWDAVKANLLNYEDLRKDISMAVEFEMKRINSIKEIFNTVSSLLSDLNPERIKQITDEIRSLSSQEIKPVEKVVEKPKRQRKKSE